LKKVFLFVLMGLIVTSFTVYSAAATVEQYNSIYELQDADNGNFTRFSIDELGNVAIGTPVPGAKLHVDASPFPPTADLIVGNGPTNSGQNTYVTIGRTAGTSGAGQVDGWVAGGGNNILALQTLFGGNVGIGTSTPGGKLHVDAGSPAPAVDVMIGSGDTGSGQNTYFTMGRSAATNGAGQIDSWLAGGGNSILALQSKFGGNVGIGTTTPSEKLEVAGNIRLIGNITSPNDICIGNCG
jgi:hypothetical protein